MTQKKSKKHFTNGLKLLGAGAGTYGLSQIALNDNERYAVDSFVNNTKNWNNSVDPRQSALEYAQSGHDIMDTKPFGLDPIKFMKFIRSPELLSKTKFKDWVWNNGSSEHYQKFKDSPLDAYLQMNKEFATGENTYTTGNYSAIRALTQQSLLGKPNNSVLDRVNKDWIHTSDNIINTPGGMENQKASLQKLLDETQPKVNIPFLHGSYTPPVFDNVYTDKLNKAVSEAAAASNTNMADATSKSELFNNLDGYLKEHNPDVWKQKQYADWAMGSHVPSCGGLYGSLVKPFAAAHSALGGAGMAAGAVGLGLSGYGLYHMIKKHIAKKQKQKALTPR